jgi:hypothetical protein
MTTEEIVTKKTSSRNDRRMVKIFLFIFIVQAAFFLILTATENLSFAVAFFTILTVGVSTFISFHTRYKLLFRTFALFVFFHILFFPWIYLKLLKNDPNAIIIDNDVYKVVNSQASDDIINKYEPVKIEQNISVLKSLVDKYPELVNRNFEWLAEDNVLITEKYVVRLTEYDPERPIRELIFYDKVGNQSTTISFRNYEIMTSKVEKSSIKDFFNTLINYYASKRSEFYLESSKIKSRDIWTFNRILPYSVNIFMRKI